MKALYFPYNKIWGFYTAKPGALTRGIIQDFPKRIQSTYHGFDKHNKD